MDTRRLKYFVQIVEDGSISRAAGHLNLSQPALSQQIRILETEMATPLLDRTSRGVVPTPAGRVLFARAQQILNDIERVRHDIANSHRTTHRATLGMAPTVMPVVGVPLLRRFLTEGNVTFRIAEQGSLQLLDMLRKRLLDFVVVPHFARIDNVKTELLYRDRLHLFAPAAWNLPPEMNLSEVAELPLAHGSEPNVTPELVHEGLARSGVTANIVAELDSLPSIRQLVREGYVATILTDWGFESDEGVSRIRLTPAMERSIYLYSRTDRKELQFVREAIVEIGKSVG
ncbi:LysR family transcriptional regulator [Rhodobacterales bacterium HKCCE2091]|nr:LysR family transcriptional regulator [Rhodobacterales bacterium HKCCE2091]